MPQPPSPSLPDPGSGPRMVLLDDAGMVNLLMGQEWQQIEAPTLAAHVLLLDQELWCRTRRGEVFRLSPGTNAKWVKCDLEPVSAMNLNPDGAICVLLADQSFLVRDESGWVPTELPTLAAPISKSDSNSQSSPQRSKPRRFPGSLVPRFSLRNLLLFILLLALLMGPILSFRKGMLQDKAAAKLMSNGELIYAYQLDDDGNPRPSPVEPGSKWLKQWIPRHCFVTPVKYKGANLELLSEFDSISEVTVTGTPDLTLLKNIKSLRRLKLLEAWDPRAEMPQLPQVEALEIDRTIEIENLQHGSKNGQNLNFLKGWSGLRSLTFREVDFGGFWTSDFLRHVPDLRELLVLDGNIHHDDNLNLKTLRHLERLEACLQTNTFDTIADLKTLKVLKLAGGWNHQRAIEQLAKLTQLETLSLEERAADYVTLKWLKQFPKLQHLSIDNLDLQDISTLGDMPNLKSLELLEKERAPTREQLQTLSDLGIKKIKVLGKQLVVANKLALRPNPQSQSSPAELVRDLCPDQELSLRGWSFKQRLSGEDRRRCLRDISWLAGEDFSSLTGLYLPAEVKDFSPIKGLDQLVEFQAEGFAFDDLSLLSKMSNLKLLLIEGTGVTDLEDLPLPIIRQLERVFLSKSKVTSVAALKSARAMWRCTFDETAVKDIPIFESGVLRDLSANKTLITDLSPLSNSLVEMVYVNHSPVKVLPKNLPELITLEASHTEISDLEFIKTYPNLVVLKLNGSPITDAGQLNHHASISELDLSGCKLEVLPSHLRGLRVLTLADTTLPDLAGLEGLPRLSVLDLSHSNVEDISELAKFNDLSTLDLSGTKVSSLAPLAGLLLSKLYLSDTHITDLSPLAGQTDLKSLDLSGTAITDVTGLPQNDYGKVDLSNTQITDLSPFIKSSRLVLNLSGTPIEDLTSLGLGNNAGMLDELDISNTRISDLSDLAQQSNLTVLNLAGTQVRDLSPLAKLVRLEKLNLSGSSVDLSTVVVCTSIEC